MSDTKDLSVIMMIDKKNKVKRTVTLTLGDDEEVALTDLVNVISEDITSKVTSGEPSICVQKIMPLMGQAMAVALIKYLGESHAAFILSQETVRMSLIHCMTIAAYMTKWINKHEAKIDTVEEPLTDEDIDKIKRLSDASDMAIQYATLGGDPKRLLRELIKAGHITAEELKEAGAEDILEIEEEEEDPDESSN